MNIELILNIAAAIMAVLVIAIIATNLIRDRKAEDWHSLSWFDKGIRIARDSAVWLLGYCQIIASAILSNVDSLANALGQPQLVAILDKYFDPKIVGYVLLASSLWFMWARARTLTKPVVSTNGKP